MKEKVLRITSHLLAFLILFLITLYFGHRYLENTLTGSDIGQHLFETSTLIRYFPRVPLWSPEQGGGSSYQGINYGSHYLTAAYSKIMNVGPEVTIKLFSFMAPLLTSFGIYLFARKKLKNWVMGLVAGIFFLISEISWVWGAEIGLYAFCITFPLYPFLLLILDFLLDNYFAQKISLITRTLYLLSILIIAIAIWMHLVTGAILLELAILYPLTYCWIHKKSFWKCLGIGITVAIGAILLSVFWLVPFQRYLSFTMAQGRTYFNFDQIPVLPVLSYFGFGDFAKLDPAFRMWYGFFALLVVVFLGVGTLVAILKKNRFILTLSLLIILFFAEANMKNIFPGLVNMFFSVFSLINIRAILPAIILVPVIAAYGLVALVEIPCSKIIRNPAVRRALIPVVVLIVLLLGLRFVNKIPTNYIGRCGTGYGVSDPQFADCRNSLSVLKTSALEIFHISPMGTGGGYYFYRELATKVQQSQFIRIDISDKKGDFIEEWNNYSKNPQFSQYSYMKSLVSSFWGYQTSTFYGPMGGESEVDQLAKWIGIDYVILDNAKNDPFEKYPAKYWQDVYSFKNVYVKKLEETQTIFEHSTKPSILVIGSIKDSSYESVFKTVVQGGLRFEDANLIDGGERLDNYDDAGKLKNFDMVILYGYKYDDKNSIKVWQTLSDYVKNGGKLFIETGFQYASPEWQKNGLPEIFPVDSTHWQGFTKWILKGDSFGTVKSEDFVSPSYNGGPWGSSVADSVRSGARALVTDDVSGKVLAAEIGFGKGIVIWSGMHIFALKNIVPENQAEALFNSLIKPQLPVGRELNDIQALRPQPENLIVKISPQNSISYFYFREAYYPDWSAKTSDGTKLEIYRSGPGFMLIPVPSGTNGVIITFKRSTVSYLSIWVSLLAFIYILSLIFAYNYHVGICRKIKNKFGSLFKEEN